MQFVGDENHCQAFGSEAFQRGKQIRRFLRRQHRGWFIENQNSRVAIQCLENFDPLAFANRKFADLCIRIDGETELFRHLRKSLPCRPGILPPSPERLSAKSDVLQNAQILGQGKVLMHHADARRDRCIGRAGRQRLVVDFYGALVGHVMAEEDIHQRGLAGAVLTQQRQHFPARQRQGDPVIGDQRAEALGDILQP